MGSVCTNSQRRNIPRGGQIEVACQGGISPLERLLGMAGGDLSPCTAALNIRMPFDAPELACICTRKGNAFHMPPSLRRPPAKMPPTQARMPARPAQLTIFGIRDRVPTLVMRPTALVLYSIFLWGAAWSELQEIVWKASQDIDRCTECRLYETSMRGPLKCARDAAVARSQEMVKAVMLPVPEHRHCE